MITITALLRAKPGHGDDVGQAAGWIDGEVTLLTGQEMAAVSK